MCVGHVVATERIVRHRRSRASVFNHVPSDHWHAGFCYPALGMPYLQHNGGLFLRVGGGYRVQVPKFAQDTRDHLRWLTQ